MTFFFKFWLYSSLFILGSISLVQAFGGEKIGTESRSSVVSKSELTLEGTKVAGMTSVEGSLIGKKATLKDVVIKGRAHFQETLIQGNTTVSGFFKFEKGNCHSLRINGGSELIEAQILGDSVVDGVMVAHNSLFSQSVTVNGSAKFSQTRFKEIVDVDGGMYAENCIFDQSCAIATDRSIFIKCQVAKITVKGGGGRGSPQHIILVRGTQVMGDILFEEEGGTVTVGEGSSIQGKVINGRIVTNMIP